MNDKHALLKANPQVCKRLFGVKYDTFEVILGKVQNHFDTHLIENSISNRGLDGEFSTANQLLLTLEYLRQYPTFLSLGFLMVFQRVMLIKFITTLGLFYQN